MLVERCAAPFCMYAGQSCSECPEWVEEYIADVWRSGIAIKNPERVNSFPGSGNYLFSDCSLNS